MPRTGRPKSPDPRIRMSFRMSGPVARMIMGLPAGKRSQFVEEAVSSFNQQEEIMKDVREDIVLSNGKVITHTRLENGAQQARPSMTEAEWKEYCKIIGAS